MNNWFECKIRYDKMMENGVQRTVTEPYLIDALSFTEAEARIIEEVKPFIGDMFSVSNIRRRKFVESFITDGSGDRYYDVKTSYITLDEKSGGEKKTTVHMLVLAEDLGDALKTVKDEMKKTLIDYRIEAVCETQIVDVFVHAVS